ncbi:Polysaccharide pyruvyl transferase [Cupriavidus sp. YR651]|nr:Polysaccharide pyruvyl transferase [Cupriavidus sp. YR651]
MHPDCPAILFGAFDRHNFGDLLLAQVMGRLLADRRLLYAGLADRDLRGHGGHRVHAITRLAAAVGDAAVDIIHVGGEILTCHAWEAAVMLLGTEPARSIIAQLDSRAPERTAWARDLLGLPDLAPYLLPAGLFPNTRRVIYHAAGGIEFDRLDRAMQDEVVAKLGSAAHVSVRDRQTRAMLAAHGVRSHLEPDPAVMVRELFGTRIDSRCHRGELAALLAAFPRGYLAMQFAAEFGDDQTLALLAGQLQRIARSTGLGVVLFRAGAAPWHDDLSCYRRLAARLDDMSVALLESLNLWDICALISRSRCYAGSSLHGGIVANAFGLPWLGLLRPGQDPDTSKQAAFWSTWGTAGAPAAVQVEAMADGVNQAMASDPVQRTRLASELVSACRASLQSAHGD